MKAVSEEEIESASENLSFEDACGFGQLRTLRLSEAFFIEVFSKLISKWCEAYFEPGHFLRRIHRIHTLVQKGKQHEGRSFEKKLYYIAVYPPSTGRITPVT